MPKGMAYKDWLLLDLPEIAVILILILILIMILHGAQKGAALTVCMWLLFSRSSIAAVAAAAAAGWRGLQGEGQDAQHNACLITHIATSWS
jgi:hypothetical protein